MKKPKLTNFLEGNSNLQDKLLVCLPQHTEVSWKVGNIRSRKYT